MKTTYLIKSIQSDGSTALVETSAEHWHEITENNKGPSKDERRYFITDIISESGNLDCMIIEVAYEEYLRWMVERSQTMRNNCGTVIESFYYQSGSTSETPGGCGERTM